MARVKTKLTVRAPECVWSHADDDTDLWEGSCGIAWSLTDGTPKDNEMAFCPRCGGHLKQVRK